MSWFQAMFFRNSNFSSSWHRRLWFIASGKNSEVWKWNLNKLKAIAGQAARDSGHEGSGNFCGDNLILLSLREGLYFCVDCLPMSLALLKFLLRSLRSLVTQRKALSPGMFRDQGNWWELVLGASAGQVTTMKRWAACRRHLKDYVKSREFFPGWSSDSGKVRTERSVGRNASCV